MLPIANDPLPDTIVGAAVGVLVANIVGVLLTIAVGVLVAAVIGVLVAEALAPLPPPSTTDTLSMSTSPVAVHDDSCVPTYTESGTYSVPALMSVTLAT